MRIWLDPDKLAALGVTLKEVSSAIQQQNLQISLGTIGDTAMPDQGKYQYTLTAKTRLDSPEEFKNIIIRENEDGSKIRLQDIARVELGSENYLSSATLNNTTEFVKVSIEEVVNTLIEALILVLLVVYFFLQSFRATIIPAVAIPVSLIGTFAFLLIAGYSINILTLFGIILAIGIVVDDAILVVENVEANLEKSPDISVKEATKEAMKEIVMPIISTTLVLMAVFVPVTFIPGISGALYRQFAMTISLPMPKVCFFSTWSVWGLPTVSSNSCPQVFCQKRTREPSSLL